MANSSAPAAWKIFGCTGTSLPPNQLLMVKLIAFTTLIMAMPVKLPAPHAPFFQIFEHVPHSLWQRSLQIIYLLASISLLCNRRVRFSSALLGVVLLLALATARTFYSNGKFYCALIFILTSLERPEGRPWLIHTQLALIYFGAAVNKSLDVDWQTGQFMVSLMNDVARSSIFEHASTFFPDMFLAQVMCWGTIFMEIVICGLILWGGSAKLLIWIIISFHGMIYVLTGTFYGTFVPAVAATLFSYLQWPTRVNVMYNAHSDFLSHLRKFVEAFDFDEIFHWEASVTDSLKLSDGKQTFSGMKAIQFLIGFLPFTYFFILFFFVSPKMSLLYSYTITIFAVLFFSPVPNIVSKMFGQFRTEST